MQLHLASVCNCYIYLYSKLQVYVITVFGKTQLSGALLPPPPPPLPPDSINEIEMIRLYDQQATLPKNTVKLKFSTPEPRSTKLKI